MAPRHLSREETYALLDGLTGHPPGSEEALVARATWPPMLHARLAKLADAYPAETLEAAAENFRNALVGARGWSPAAAFLGLAARCRQLLPRRKREAAMKGDPGAERP